jgi:hypothetical protein
MLLSPLLSFFTLGVLGLFTIEYILVILFNLYGIILVVKKQKIVIPDGLYLLIGWIIYRLVWEIVRGSIYTEGVLEILRISRFSAIYFAIVIIYNTSFSEKFIKNSFLFFKITVLATISVSIIQIFDPSFLDAKSYFKSDFIRNTKSIYEVRRSSIFGFIDANALGLSFIPIVSILIGHQVIRYGNPPYKYIVLSGLVAILSNTRYVMIAFTLVALQVIVSYRYGIVKRLKNILYVVIFLIVLLLLTSYLGYDFYEFYRTRLFSEGSITETTRYAAIINFLEFFPQYPIFGNGYLYDPEVIAASMKFGSSHIHVGYLSHLVAYGVMGCFFLFGFWFMLLKRLFKNARLTGYWGSFYAFLTFLLAFATFSQPSIFYYGLLYAFVFDKYHIDKYG